MFGLGLFVGPRPTHQGTPNTLSSPFTISLYSFSEKQFLSYLFTGT